MNASSASSMNSLVSENDSAVNLLSATAFSALKWEEENHINDFDTLNAKNSSSNERFLNEKNYNKSFRNKFKISL